MAIISSRLYTEPVTANVGEVLESVSNEGIYQACAESHFGMCRLCEAIMMADIALEESVYNHLLEADGEEKKEEVTSDANEKAEAAKESFKQKAIALIEKIKTAAIEFYEKIVAAFRKAFKMDALVAHTEAELEGLDIPAGAKVKLALPNLANGNSIVDAAVKMLDRFLTSAVSNGTDIVNFGNNLDKNANIEKVREAYKAKSQELTISKEQIKGSISFLKKKEEMLKSIESEKALVIKACETAAKEIKQSKDGDVSKLAKVVEGCCSRISKMFSIKASMYKEAYKVHNKYLFAAVKVAKNSKTEAAKSNEDAKDESKKEDKEEPTKESSVLDLWFNFDQY